MREPVALWHPDPVTGSVSVLADMCLQTYIAAQRDRSFSGRVELRTMKLRGSVVGWATVIGVVVATVIGVGQLYYARQSASSPSMVGRGGDGGMGTIIGNNGTIVGGPGGGLV